MNRKAAHDMVSKLVPERLQTVTISGEAEVDHFIRTAAQVTLTYTTLDGNVFQGTGVAYKHPSDIHDDNVMLIRAKGRAEISLGMQMLAAAFDSYKDATDEAKIKCVHRLPGDNSWKRVKALKRKSLSQADVTVLLSLLDAEDMFALSAEQPLP